MESRYTNTGIIELDIHGMTKYQAKICIDSQLKRANSSVYRIRIVHGYHNGTELKDMVYNTYRKHPRVMRVEVGLNLGMTDLVLREFM
jgi:DNA-nicking Smr family endonuclease